MPAAAQQLLKGEPSAVRAAILSILQPPALPSAVPPAANSPLSRSSSLVPTTAHTPHTTAHSTAHTPHSTAHPPHATSRLQSSSFTTAASTTLLPSTSSAAAQLGTSNSLPLPISLVAEVGKNLSVASVVAVMRTITSGPPQDAEVLAACCAMLPHAVASQEQRHAMVGEVEAMRKLVHLGGGPGADGIHAQQVCVCACGWVCFICTVLKYWFLCNVLFSRTEPEAPCTSLCWSR
jgi:hypothetical protein